MFAQRGTNDDFMAEYPATPEEALAPEQLDRRLPLEWVLAVSETDIRPGVLPLAVPGLAAWAGAMTGRRYVIGVDPAEGNVHNDESVACVLDGETWAQVALLVGRVEPATFAGYLVQLASYYNGADVLVERNNHGHLVIREVQCDGA